MFLSPSWKVCAIPEVLYNLICKMRKNISQFSHQHFQWKFGITNRREKMLSWMSRIVLNLYFLKFLLCMHKILKNMRNAFYNSVAGKMDDPHKNKKKFNLKELIIIYVFVQVSVDMFIIWLTMITVISVETGENRMQLSSCEWVWEGGGTQRGLRGRG